MDTGLLPQTHSFIPVFSRRCKDSFKAVWISCDPTATPHARTIPRMIQIKALQTGPVIVGQT
jgi:hypothetical protein